MMILRQLAAKLHCKSVLFHDDHSVAIWHTEQEAQLLLWNGRSYANHHLDNNTIPPSPKAVQHNKKVTW